MLKGGARTCTLSENFDDVVSSGNTGQVMRRPGSRHRTAVCAHAAVEMERLTCGAGSHPF